MTGSEYLAHSAPLFVRTEILKLEDIHKIVSAVFMFKNQSLLTYPDHPYDMRQSDNPIFSYPRLTQSRHCT